MMPQPTTSKHEKCPLFLESFTNANRTVLLDAEGNCRKCARLGKSNVLAADHPREGKNKVILLTIKTLIIKTKLIFLPFNFFSFDSSLSFDCSSY
jgi:hypothetical protein